MPVINKKLARFDVQAFYLEVDAHRVTLGLSWNDVARATGVSNSTFTYIRRGTRIDIDGAVALAVWAKLDLNRFVRIRSNFKPPEKP